MAGESSKFTLTYFPARGRGEQLRLVLAEGGADWEFAGVGFPEFAAMKSTLAFGSLPCVDYQGQRLVQSLSTVKFIGKTLGQGLYPEGAASQYRVDMILDGCEDLRIQGYKAMPMFGAAAETTAKFIAEGAPRYMGALGALLGEADFFGGENRTVADLVAFDVITFIEDLIPGITAKYPNLAALQERVASLPNVASYIASDKRFGAFSPLPVPGQE